MFAKVLDVECGRVGLSDCMERSLFYMHNLSYRVTYAYVCGGVVVVLGCARWKDVVVVFGCCE